MAVDKLIDSQQLDTDLTSVANAIRGQTNTSGDLSFPNGFVSSINSINKSLGITEATVGQIAKITAVDTNGQPTAWEAVEVYPKKVFDITSPDNYNMVDVLAINYETGELTISENDSEITDSYSTTVSVIAVPAVSGQNTTFRIGQIPVEIWNQIPDLSNIRSFRAVKTGENTIKLYTNANSSGVPIESYTESDTIDLNKFKLLIKKSKSSGNAVRYQYSGLNPNKSYKIRISSPYTLLDDGSFQVDGFGTASRNSGYASYSLAPAGYGNPNGGVLNNGLYINGTNGYETFGIRYFKRYWGSWSPSPYLPFIAEAVLSKVSDDAWTLAGKFVSFESENGLKTGNARITTVEQSTTIYSQTPPTGINAVLGINGSKFEIWELG